MISVNHYVLLIYLFIRNNSKQFFLDFVKYCLCYGGWTGEFCEINSNLSTTHVPTTKTSTTKTSTTTTITTTTISTTAQKSTASPNGM